MNQAKAISVEIHKKIQCDKTFFNLEDPQSDISEYKDTSYENVKSKPKIMNIRILLQNWFQVISNTYPNIGI